VKAALIKVQTNTNDRLAITFISKKGKTSVSGGFLSLAIFSVMSHGQDTARGFTEHIIGDIRQRAGRASYISHINGVSPRGVQRSGPATRGSARTGKCESHEHIMLFSPGIAMLSDTRFIYKLTSRCLTANSLGGMQWYSTRYAGICKLQQHHGLDCEMQEKGRWREKKKGMSVLCETLLRP
jgi:hypothetical protein